MNHIHKYLPHVQGNGQFLPTLPEEGLLFCFAGLYFATYKLPK